MEVQPDGGGAGRRDRGAKVRRDRRHEEPRGKHTFVLSDEAFERLTVHATKQKVDRSELVESLICGQLRRYVVQDRGGRPPLERSADQADGVNNSVEAVPVGETVSPPEVVGEAPSPGAGEGVMPERARRRGQAGAR